MKKIVVLILATGMMGVLQHPFTVEASPEQIDQLIAATLPIIEQLKTKDDLFFYGSDNDLLSDFLDNVKQIKAFADELDTTEPEYIIYEQLKQLDDPIGEEIQISPLRSFINPTFFGVKAKDRDNVMQHLETIKKMLLETNKLRRKASNERKL